MQQNHTKNNKNKKVKKNKEGLGPSEVARRKKIYKETNQKK